MGSQRALHDWADHSSLCAYITTEQKKTNKKDIKPKANQTKLKHNNESYEEIELNVYPPKQQWFYHFLEISTNNAQKVREIILFPLGLGLYTKPGRHETEGFAILEFYVRIIP